MYKRENRSYVSSDFREHAAFLEEHNVFLQPRSRPTVGSFLTSFSARFMPSAYVARVRYGAAFQIRKAELAWSWHHVLSMPIAGDLSSAQDGHRSIARPEEYAVRPPTVEQVFDTTDQSDELFLALDPDFMQTFCARLLGEPLTSPITFRTSMPAKTPHGRALRAASETYLHESRMDGGAGGISQDEEFQDFFAATLLMHHPHTYWEELNGRAPLAAPRDVKRALDYIHANLTETIRLEDLTNVANVPGRTLNEHFRRFVGVAPIGYVKTQRLKLARRLLTARTGLSVTSVATQCGFIHLGRFSVEYKRAFGETPSETRGRFSAATEPDQSGSQM